MDLAIAIRIGSPQSTLKLVSQTIESIQKNIGKCAYRFILSLDPKVPQDIKNYIREKQKEFPERFEVFPEGTLYWGEFINRAIQSAQDCEYFIKAHDDIILITPNFFPILKKILDSIKEPYAWVNFDDINYLNGYWSPPTRPGFYKDFLKENAWDRKKMLQFHRLPDKWWRTSLKEELFCQLQNKLEKILFFVKSRNYPYAKMEQEYRNLLDMPAGPVKCHAPWNMFVLIKTSVLNEIGPCENWQTYHALLVDEDWGLRALQLKYWNIWIPSLKYLHVRLINGGNRAQCQIGNDAKRTHVLFEKKWGFCSPPTEEQLKEINWRHKDNYIPWSIERNSFDWDYLKLKK